MNNIKEEQVLEFFKTWHLDNESQRYLGYHSKRYEYLLSEISKLVPSNDEFDILDIGAAYQTALLRNYYPKVNIDTLGFFDKRFPPREIDVHHELDLNLFKNSQIDKKYDLIVFSEVIEHLYTSPVVILKYLRSLLKDDGVIIIQTPNASSLWKRISLLMGKNPYELIRIDSEKNPGHFREYTIKELKIITEESGFTVSNFSIKNYFNKENLKHKLCDLLTDILFDTLREGITINLKKSKST